MASLFISHTLFLANHSFSHVFFNQLHIANSYPQTNQQGSTAAYNSNVVCLVLEQLKPCSIG